jgi:hypothetical protein
MDRFSTTLSIHAEPAVRIAEERIQYTMHVTDPGAYTVRRYVDVRAGLLASLRMRADMRGS